MKGWCQARDWEINANEGTVEENIDNSFKSLNCKEEKKRGRKKAILEEVAHYREILLILWFLYLEYRNNNVIPETKW